MLSNTLVTNEVKNALGTEVEFSRVQSADRTTVFAAVGETPSAPHRLSIKHAETGTGIDKRRRSMYRFDKTVTGQVDATKPANIGGYFVMDIPVGNLTSYTEVNNVMAEVLSFGASTGADTTIKYDGSGNGAAALRDGTL